MDKILTVKEIAELIKVQPMTVRQMFRENRLRGFKVGKSWRTTEPMLEEDIAAMTAGSPPAPMPAAKAPAKRPKPKAVEAPAPVSAAAPSKQVTAEEPKPNPTPTKRSAKSKTGKTQAPGAASPEDDSQQMLF